MEAVRHLLSTRLLSGVAVATAALAVLVLAAPPGPASVVAIGEPSTYTGPAHRDERDRALPSCPAPSDVSAATVSLGARRVAERFVAAWASGVDLAMLHLSEPTFHGRAQGLALVSGGPGTDAKVRVSGMGHDPLAGPLGERCGPQALTLMRIVGFRPTATASVTRLYVVWRPGGSRVWALR